jgi:hypothetical protein
LPPRTDRNYRRVPERHEPESDLGWLIGGTFVLALLGALVIYVVTRPNAVVISPQPTTMAPQANTVGPPKSDDRVQTPISAPGINR